MSWDRRCPAFLQEKAKLREKRPENYYRYYPLARDPTTWVTHEESFAGMVAERWMGNESRSLYNAGKATQQDNGWGNPLGIGLRKGADTWRPRAVDSYVPKSTQGEQNRGSQMERTQDRRRETNRSKSRGRTTQQTQNK